MKKVLRLGMPFCAVVDTAIAWGVVSFAARFTVCLRTLPGVKHVRVWANAVGDGSSADSLNELMARYGGFLDCVRGVDSKGVSVFGLCSFRGRFFS
jgi:hypothetical protein